MSIERIERTSIWKASLAFKDPDENKSERENLRNSFLKFRKNTSFLVSNIAKAIPELTQHDITHLDALWETSSIIVGEDFQLTPLEGFVLGGSFLLHDSALCFEVFENGRQGLRETVQWQDSFSVLKENLSKQTIDEVQHHADFEALRNLHAVQAETLLSRKWTDTSTGNEFYLLEDQELRTHLGKLIGQIAASHHWDIEKVASVFNSQQNVPVGYPREWRIDPVKIACILRCADAAHIDNERAPDFLHALLKRSGVSYNHWVAQNRLAKVDIDQKDSSKTSLLFTSTIDFKEEDSEAWFVAYDAVCLVDKEIKACNSVLENLSKISFQVKRVRGVESPEIMSQYVKASGWKPCSAKVHISNIERIVHNLGGEMLYGTGSDMLGIAIRELIQNARDSVKARSVYDKNFEERITLSATEELDSMWITVEDNGVGMSERILTGPLLDFGTSFWTSSLVQSEFPGLRSSEFKSIGKFGIGFYSIFMIADKVLVASRNWSSGLSDVNQLKFNKGFSLQPILTKACPADFRSSISTQIKIRLKPNTIAKDLSVEIRSNRMGSNSLKVPFENYAQAICAGLDTKVFYRDSNDSERIIHNSILSKDFDKQTWLKEISFLEYQLNKEELEEYIGKNFERLKPIFDDGVITGLAAISTKPETNQQDFLSIATVGGLAFSVHNRDGKVFLGYMDHSPKSAKREMGGYTASEGALQKWADEQLQDLLKLNLSPVEKYFSASALSEFKVDPTPIAQILTSYENKHTFLSIDQLAELSLIRPIVFLDSGLSAGHMETHHQVKAIPGHVLIMPLTNSSFLSLARESNVPKNNFSILDCVYRGIIRKGYKPKLTERIGVTRNVFNRSVNAIILSAGR